MKFLFYTQSLVSDWNHGNAHFLRGVMRELVALGHWAQALEPAHSWSRTMLEAEQGHEPQRRFIQAFPELEWQLHDDGFDHEAALDEADVVIVHEWTDPALIARIGCARKAGGRFFLCFHDTHHRAVSAEGEIAGIDLSGYDLVLAFGEVLRSLYARRGWHDAVVTWHEAADTRLFRPMPEIGQERDLVWIGNWGDGEREAELLEYLVEPARAIGMSGQIHGVRYPVEALDAIAAAGLEYRGWIANIDVPAAFAAARMTVHVPRRPYVEALPGIPTIRVFEALACGIPLICAPWDDTEGLFRPGVDFLVVSNGTQMKRAMLDILCNPPLAKALSQAGQETIRARHSCAHRARELLAILARHGVRSGGGEGRPGQPGRDQP